jgi:hypothetical protein
LKHIRKRLTYANVMSSIAVFLVIGGGAAFAALGKNTVGTKQLKKNAVTTAKIKKNAVNAAKIKSGSVNAAKLANGSVLGEKLAGGAVGTDQLADNAVTTSKIANDAVTGDKVKESTLGEVPSAANATNATNATNAANALTAVKALGAASPETLASGETETGLFYGIETPGTGNSGFVSAVISFPFPLASPPTENYRPIGSLPDAACPGTAKEPEAAPGNLCAYETVNGTSNTAFFDGAVSNELTKYGDGIAVAVSNQSFNSDLIGTWAVTAP